jgi:hypothetical protein
VDVDVLIEEATRRSGLVWVTPDGTDRAHPVWHLWHDGAMYVVTGGIEQPLPSCTRAVVAVRSRERQGDLLVAWVADVAAVAPGTPTWDEVVPLLHTKRLNAPDGEDQPARWSREGMVLRFVPTGETVPAGSGQVSRRIAGSPASTR